MRIIFMGTPQFSVKTLEMLIDAGHEIVGVVTQPDRPQGRGKKLSPSAIKMKAQELGLTIYQPEKVKDPSFIEQLAQLKPDVIVVVAYGQILSKEILELPPFGCINVHASLLPKYRGAAPIHWSIINGEKETGVTIMEMDQGLDTGAMLLKGSVEITPNLTTGELHDHLAFLGGELLIKTLDIISTSQLKPEVQLEHESSYAPLLKKHHEKINWQANTREIHNLVRGLNPWPGAYTFLDNQRLKIWETSLMEYPGLKIGEVGEIIGLSDHGFWVQTGDKPILITKVQPAGRNVMAALAFANGYNIALGQFLGESDE